MLSYSATLEPHISREVKLDGKVCFLGAGSTVQKHPGHPLCVSHIRDLNFNSQETKPNQSFE
jgi:hypothetical protein